MRSGFLFPRAEAPSPVLGRGSLSRLPVLLNISIDGIRGHELLEAVPEIAASTGSACHSGDHRPSPVLSAMGLPKTRSLAALRLSLGRWTTADDIDRTVELITAACEQRAGI